MCCSYEPRVGFPPMNSTVASGSRSEFEWYKRGKAFWPADVNVLETRSYRSALRLAVPVSSSFKEPPTASTFPFGRIVAFISIRDWDMEGPGLHLGDAAERSMSSVVLVEGLPPPMIMTMGR